MLQALLMLFLTGAAPVPPDTLLIYHGALGRVDVDVPRHDARVRIDGLLDEEVWQHAALLTGFSQYQPVDGRRADDSTEVHVWYTRDAIYFGIRAFARQGTVRATLAGRDQVGNDDYVQILLDTFGEQRQAYSFGVNPLGVQSDGMRQGMGTDNTQDFVYQSRGRITPGGFEVEVRIPFKSLRYATPLGDWGINIVRKVQYTDRELTWTPVRRAGGPFLTQAGRLQGLSGLRRGLVLELNPSAVGKVSGSRQSDAGWDYESTPEAGLAARWGVTSSLTLDAAVNPDFSQVESDAGQIPSDERFALSFSEKRPFFLEGIERFNVPNRLIYTRSIADPDVGLKLTGSVSGNQIALLSAVDAPASGATQRALINVLRLQRNVGRSSTVGLAYTDRVRGPTSNRVLGVDTRLDFATMYYAQLQAAGSVDRSAGPARRGTLFEGVFDRTGRSWGFHHSLRAVHPDFSARTGFSPRTGYIEGGFNNRFTAYPPRGGLIQTWTMRPNTKVLWNYRRSSVGDPLETELSFDNNLSLRRGWSVSFTPRWETIRFDPAEYTDLAVESAPGVFTPFQVPDRLTGIYRFNFGFDTAELGGFEADMDLTVGKDVVFAELAEGGYLSFSAGAQWRPTAQLRLDADYRLVRRSRPNGEWFSTQHLPRLKLEYQVSRPLFIRLVTEYSSESRAQPHDWRTGAPLLQRNSTGGYDPVAGRESHVLRVDWLFSYQPGPGTVFFAGYGSRLGGSDAFDFGGMSRLNDGFFLKASYLFRS